MKKEQKIFKFMNLTVNYLMGLLSFIVLLVSLHMGVNVVYAQETENAISEVSEPSLESEAEQNTDDLYKNKSEMASPENFNFRGYDVVYVIDNSKSVWNQQGIRNQAFRNISNLAVGSDIRIGIVYFADHVYNDNTLALTSMASQDGSKKVLDCLNMTKQDEENIDTNIGTALEAAISLFDNQDTSRKRIVILFSDGINENLNRQADYVQSADKKTKEQARILKEMNIPIYCVYLQKNRNDEEYLKQLVNYFSQDNSYVSERFSKITNDEVNTLSDKFAEVFYAMQNNMKYHKITWDSFGGTNFYVPSLGIQKLQIYLDGNIKNATVTPEEAELEKWEDGTAYFISCVNPPPQNWSIDVSSTQLDKVSGTIAYYVNLQAAAELVQVQNPEGGNNDAKAYQVIVHFYDENNNEIQIDPMVTVDTAIIISDEDEQETQINLEINVDEGVAKSNIFSINSYGNYRYQVNLAYEDFVDLNYSINGGIIEKTAPIVYNMENEHFYGEKTEDGKIRFSIKEDRLCIDPDGETIIIKNVVQLNAANPVIVELNNGYFNVTAEKASDVNFALQLEDSSGMTAEVTVQGMLTNRGIARMIEKITILVVLLLICICIFSTYKKKKKRENLSKKFIEFEQIQEEVNAVLADCQEQRDIFQENELAIGYALEGVSNTKGIVELANELTREQQKNFEVTKYLETDYREKVLSEAKNTLKSIDDAKRSMDICEDKVKSTQKNPKGIENSANTLSDCCEIGTNELNNLKNGYEKLKKQNSELDETIKKIGKIAGMIEKMLQTKITCDLVLKVLNKKISGMPNVMGRMNCCNHAGEFLQGYYVLDDVTLLESGRLGQIMGKTDIYVYGYEDEFGKVGLELRSNRAFTCKPIQERTEPVSEKQAILLKGNSYELIYCTDNQEVHITLSVR